MLNAQVYYWLKAITFVNIFTDFSMQLIKKHGILIFWLVLFADCAVLYLEQKQYHTYLKPLLIPILLVFFWTNTKSKKYAVSTSLITVALIFSWLGDMFLLKQREENSLFFLLGMISFLMTHILYIIFFIRVKPIQLVKGTEAFFGAVITIIASSQVFRYVEPNLGDLKVPVVIYMVVISLMAVTATNIASSKTLRNLAIQYFIPGAGLFLLSDAVLALDTFFFKESFLGVVVMMSYGYAQCLLVQGFTKYLKV